MAAIIIETQPVCEPVSLTEAKSFLRVYHAQDDELISGLIRAAREYAEGFTRRSFINKGFCQFLDCFPYYTDSIHSQNAYPPSYYSAPQYSTSLWNYSQMIKLFYAPLVSVSKVTYINGQDGRAHDLLPGTPADRSGDFVIDTASEPPRLFPNPQGHWPPCLYVPNSVAIHFVAGYNDDAKIAAAVKAWKDAQDPAPDAAAIADYEAGLRRADVPQVVKLAIKQFCAHWYEHRESVTAEDLKTAPQMVDMLLWNIRVLDMAPTRG